MYRYMYERAFVILYVFGSLKTTKFEIKTTRLTNLRNLATYDCNRLITIRTFHIHVKLIQKLIADKLHVDWSMSHGHL